MLFYFLVVLTIQGAWAKNCARVYYTDESYVCACNATYCDTVNTIVANGKGEYVAYSSSQAGGRLDAATGSFSNTSASNSSQVTIEITRSSLAFRQTILGFGGAFTDAAGINILNLTQAAQDKLLSSYYGNSGIQYSVGRVPMASTDFSTHVYSYDDTPGDMELKDFGLTKEDMQYKIPIIKRAQAMSSRNISLFGSPWSAPAWMKTSGTMVGKGRLNGTAGDTLHKTWAQYYVRFLDEYKKSGLDFWGLTVQNEPMDCGLPGFKFQCMYYSGEMEGDFVAQDLGPALQNSGHGAIKLMILDDDRLQLPGFAKAVYSRANASKYVSGVATHWYIKALGSYSRLDETHALDPSKFILATEASAGYLPFDTAVVMGSWQRARDYASDIIQNLNNWVVGWTDWNLALDKNGGPNWVKNYVDSPIIVDAQRNTFFKQPMFYALGHFSKFLPPGSRVIELKVTGSGLEVVGAVDPQGKTVVVVHNRGSNPVTFTLFDPNRGYINRVAPGSSIETLVWE